MSGSEKAEFVEALKGWVETVMHLSMHGFIGHAKEEGLSLSQLGALFYVHHRGACSMSAVKEHLSVTGGAASQLLDRLVRQGYLVRTEDDQDRRAKRIEMTPRGERIVHATVEARQRWFLDLAESLNPTERVAATATLQTLSKRTQDIEGATK